MQSSRRVSGEEAGWLAGLAVIRGWLSGPQHRRDVCARPPGSHTEPFMSALRGNTAASHLSRPAPPPPDVCIGTRMNECHCCMCEWPLEPRAGFPFKQTGGCLNVVVNTLPLFNTCRCSFNKKLWMRVQGEKLKLAWYSPRHYRARLTFLLLPFFLAWQLAARMVPKYQHLLPVSYRIEFKALQLFWTVGE